MPPEEQGRAGEERDLVQFRRLVLSVRDYAIFMLDPSGRIATWNAGAEHLKGYRADEIVGRHFSTFYTEPDRARNHPANELEIAKREGRYQEEGWRVRKDGTTFWASVTITAVHDEEGRLTGFAKVTRDLTERKIAEDALREALEELRAANLELDRFASVAAHDIADPLRTIAGFAELMTRGGRPPEEMQELAGYILDSATRLTSLLRKLLDYARAGRTSGDHEPVRLATTIEEVTSDLDAILRERSARIAVDVPADALVSANEHDVRLIVQNLVANAVKFVEGEPIVAVAVAPAGADAWRLTIADNGPGIPLEEQAAIFTPFTRISTAGGQPGHGLGLATCRRLVERHGGDIGVESEPGRGSTFWVTLPVAAG